MPLLHIYDGDDPRIVATARARTVPGTRHILAVTGNGSNLLTGLNALVTGRNSFERILFETHGCPGNIFFGIFNINASWVLTNMSNHNYQNLCPVATRLYFNGCNVGAEPGGRAFLKAMAQVFLKNTGGSVFAHTSIGWEIPLYSSITGHAVHIGGSTITLYVGTGGRVIEQDTRSDI